MSRWRILFFLFLISVITYVDRVNIAVAGVQMGGALGLTRVELGTIFSAFALGNALFQIPGGWLGDRFGHKRVLTLALIWWSLFTSLTAWVGTSGLVLAFGLVPTLFIVRFLIGLGEAASYPCANGLVRLWFPSTERGRATGVILGGIGVGSAITPPLVAVLMLRFGWQSAFYIAGALGIGLALAFHFGAARTRRLGESSASFAASLTQKTPWLDVFKNKQIWLLTASSFFSGYVAYIFISWFYVYLVDVRGFTLLRGSFYAALPFIATTIGFPLGGLLGDVWASRVGTTRARRNVVIAGFLPASLLLYFGATVGNPHWAIAALTLTAGLGAMTHSSFWVTAIETTPSRAATIVGISNTGFNLGGVCSPIIIPWIATRYGWATALSAGSLACLAVVILWMFMGAPRRRLEPIPHAKSRHVSLDTC